MLDPGEDPSACAARQARLQHAVAGAEEDDAAVRGALAPAQANVVPDVDADAAQHNYNNNCVAGAEEDDAAVRGALAPAQANVVPDVDADAAQEQDAAGDLPAADEAEPAGPGAEGQGAPAAPTDYSCVVRCASQSSLDESSRQPPAMGPGGEGATGGTTGHAAGLLAALGGLREARLLTDVQLYAVADAGDAEGDEPPAASAVSAHRAVLAAASPYFRAMFTAFEERARHAVTLRGVEPAALDAIVRYIYEPASLRVTEHNVQALLAAASLLQVVGARDLAAAFLAAQLQPDNALGIRAFADLHGCRDLALAATNHVDANAEAVLRGDEWVALDALSAAALLQRDQLQLPGEECALDAAVRWALHTPDRLPQLGALLEHVRLPLVARDVLVQRAAEEPLLSAGLRVKDLVIEALSYHLLRGEARAAAALRLTRARPRRPPRAPPVLLVVGGQAPKAVRDVEALELETGGWRTLGELPTRRCRAGLAAVGTRVLVVGGFNGALRVRSVDVYDAATDTWSPGPALGARRSTLGVAVLGPMVYAVGGFDGAAGLSSCEVLDARAPAGGWRPIAPMSTRRSSVGVAALEGCVYAVGGYDGVARQCLASVERYSPATDVWERAPDMAARRSGAAVAALDGALWAAGGHDGPAVRRSVERYTPAVGWQGAPPMGCARRNAGVAAHGERLYVVGGDDGQANLSSVEVLHAGAWTTLTASMALGRSYAGVCVLCVPHTPVPAAAAAAHTATTS